MHYTVVLLFPWVLSQEESIWVSIFSDILLKNNIIQSCCLWSVVLFLNKNLLWPNLPVDQTVILQWAVGTTAGRNEGKAWKSDGLHVSYPRICNSPLHLIRLHHGNFCCSECFWLACLVQHWLMFLSLCSNPSIHRVTSSHNWNVTKQLFNYYTILDD